MVIMLKPETIFDSTVALLLFTMYFLVCHTSLWLLIVPTVTICYPSKGLAGSLVLNFDGLAGTGAFSVT